MKGYNYSNMKPARPSTRCRLLELPRELRDTIYEHVFPNPVVRIGTSDKEKIYVPDILLTCHQIHDESVEKYYKPLIIHSPTKDPRSAIRTISRLPPQHIMRIILVRYEYDVKRPSDPIVKIVAQLKTNLAYLRRRATSHLSQAPSLAPLEIQVTPPS